jgi:hypothetical protein
MSHCHNSSERISDTSEYSSKIGISMMLGTQSSSSLLRPRRRDPNQSKSKSIHAFDYEEEEAPSRFDLSSTALQGIFPKLDGQNFPDKSSGHDYTVVESLILSPLPDGISSTTTPPLKVTLKPRFRCRRVTDTAIVADADTVTSGGTDADADADAETIPTCSASTPTGSASNYTDTDTDNDMDRDDLYETPPSSCSSSNDDEDLSIDGQEQHDHKISVQLQQLLHQNQEYHQCHNLEDVSSATCDMTTTIANDTLVVDAAAVTSAHDGIGDDDDCSLGSLGDRNVVSQGFFLLSPNQVWAKEEEEEEEELQQYRQRQQNGTSTYFSPRSVSDPAPRLSFRSIASSSSRRGPPRIFLKPRFQMMRGDMY